MERYLEIKSNNIQINATTWMNLENVMLRERSQQRETHIVTSFIQNVHNSQIFRNRK